MAIVVVVVVDVTSAIGEVYRSSAALEMLDSKDGESTPIPR